MLEHIITVKVWVISRNLKNDVGLLPGAPDTLPLLPAV